MTNKTLHQKLIKDGYSISEIENHEKCICSQLPYAVYGEMVDSNPMDVVHIRARLVPDAIKGIEITNK